MDEWKQLEEFKGKNFFGKAFEEALYFPELGYWGRLTDAFSGAMNVFGAGWGATTSLNMFQKGGGGVGIAGGSPGEYARYGIPLSQMNTVNNTFNIDTVNMGDEGDMDNLSGTVTDSTLKGVTPQ
jgi:hypothetical protein